MSRIGKKAVPIPSGVTADIDGRTVSVKGPKGQLTFVMNDLVLASRTEDGSILIEPLDETKPARASWGMTRTQVANLVKGVTTGFEKRLEISGVGYKAAVQGKVLNLSLGYSHDINYPIPDGIQIACPRPTEIMVSGIDQQRVGQVAAEIRKFREPEPYKGKGVKYAGESIVRKEGKKK